MKSVAVFLIQLSLVFSMALASEKAPAPETPAEPVCPAEPAEAAEAASAGTSSLALASAPASPQSLPACPQLQNCGGVCGGITPCFMGDLVNEIDTGITSCTQPNGSTFTCPGNKTIHIEEQPCLQCRCCNLLGPRRCLCPLDCGAAIISVGCK